MLLVMTYILTLPTRALSTAPSPKEDSWRLPRPREGESFRSSTSRGSDGDKTAKLQRQHTDQTKERTRIQVDGEDKQDEKDKGRRKGKRGGRRRTQARERKLTVKDTGLKDLLLTMCKLLSKVSSQTRALWSILTYTVIIDKTVAAVTYMQTEIRAFGENADALRERLASARKNPDGLETSARDKGIEQCQTALRAVGPPAPHLMTALLEGLLTMDIGRGQRLALEPFQVAWKVAPPAQIEICKLERTHNQDTVKLVWAAPRAEDFNQKLVAAFSAYGADSTSSTCHVPTGICPQGYLEEELSEWIHSLEP